MARRVLLALGASLAAAGTTTIDWNAQFSADPKTTTVDADADLIFSWTGGHDVWIMADEFSYEECDFTGGTFLGDSSGVEVSAQPGETVYYSCGVPASRLSPETPPSPPRARRLHRLAL